LIKCTAFSPAVCIQFQGKLLLPFANIGELLSPWLLFSIAEISQWKFSPFQSLSAAHFFRQIQVRRQKWIFESTGVTWVAARGETPSPDIFLPIKIFGYRGEEE
jgi:hypothetical protein